MIMIKTLILLILLSINTFALAYIGPGAGLSAIGSLIAFIGAIFLMIIGFFWYPIKRIIKGNPADDNSEDDEDEETDTPTSTNKKHTTE